MEKPSGNLIRRERIFPDLSEERYIDRFFSVLFWGYWAATYASFVLQYGEGERRVGFLVGTLAFALLALTWVLLPWNPRASRVRLLAVPAFPALSFAIVYATDFGLSVGLYSVALANSVFLFGFRRAIPYAALLLALIFADYLLTSPDGGSAEALERTAVWAPAFAFVIGICAVAQRAVRRFEESRSLLAKLESANDALRRSAERVRELAISEERTRIAREMHDSLGHHLTAVDLQLKAARRLQESEPEKAREAVARAEGAAAEAMREVRRAVRALRPLGLEERRGAGAMAALARGYGGTGVSVSFGVSGEERVLSAEAELLLYRALQEGLTNALKHSGAERVEARLVFSPRSVCLSVTDDGVGMDGGAPEGAGGFGLAGLKERVSGLGGTMMAGNREGGGFEMQVELPVSEQ
ncbi:Signal transduction histidine kinase (plasmid) [Rubrobacter radiotolerans]|uniref:Oxygen sensor histidine kinase NreB n=1 Tax=Rubrobacter radiotolerans TaxID=42256 RepID=A0A023X7K9_RUBRA|nr:sensor histidine kinase [Rubrobacter radiotolerans]AHY48196.1 Signal transduction histidine kinase [Rubrobacter radiotolerans]MDX5895234.1 sensor histidine kinase [Rubrobacter radiotolerans]SMC01848.1 Signal transduction histidine kinase [Rubrobacter radiotolerans DSM 5868]